MCNTYMVSAYRVGFSVARSDDQAMPELSSVGRVIDLTPTLFCILAEAVL